MTTPSPHPDATRLEAGAPGFARTVALLFFGGFSCFATLYATQPLLPQLAAEFGVTPAVASTAVSAGTAALALMLIPSAVLSDRIGRKTLMSASLALATLFALLSALAPNHTLLVACRMLVGLSLAGLPAVAMTYLREEIGSRSHSLAMGIYIGGNALGGMAGRVFTAVLAGHFSWRIALAAGAVQTALVAFCFWRFLPDPRHSVQARHSLRSTLRAAAGHLADPALRRLFAVSFLIMGAFISLYNYLSFHLLNPLFRLSAGEIGMVFALYLVGSVASPASAALSARLGRHRLLWLMIVVMLLGLAATLPMSLAAVVGGVAIFTFGFFSAHATAAAWVGRQATQHHSLASALYLSAYYLGASLIGTLSGVLWPAFAWHGIAAVIGAALLAALIAALGLPRRAP